MSMDHDVLVQYLAKGKAMDVVGRIDQGLVIGSDTFCVLNDQRIGKPKDKEHAMDMLYAISDQWITVYSGIVIIDVETKKEFSAAEVTEIKIKKMSKTEIEAYIATGEPLDKAGAFAIQGRGVVFIERISGCYTGVVGLPLHRLYIGLQEMGVDVWGNA